MYLASVTDQKTLSQRRTDISPSQAGDQLTNSQPIILPYLQVSNVYLLILGKGSRNLNRQTR